jgi:hypothetical protein
MSSNIHPVIASQILGTTTSAEYQLMPSHGETAHEEKLEKLKADAVALLHRLETASADIELTSE